VNSTLSAFVLLSVPGLPLLLAIPPLRSRLSWPCHIGLLPAVILLAFPAVFSIELPWLIFGSGLGIDAGSRLILAMAVVVWAAAATLLQVPGGRPTDNSLTLFFLLTMAGNLGAILATELVGFFAFSTLMGYGFYSLLVAGGDKDSRRDGHAYLIVLVLADLALFEALLIAASTTEDLRFAVVREIMARSPASSLYMAMVLAGFAAKAAVWPLHFWLPLVYRSARPAVAMLVGCVPVAVGLVGFVRWLPLGDFDLPGPGMIIQGIGAAAILYAILAGLMQAQLKMLPVYVAIVSTGLFVTALGAGLADPAAWNRLANWAYVFIATLGIGVAVLTVVIRWLELGNRSRSSSSMQSVDSNLQAEYWLEEMMRWATRICVDTLLRLRTSGLAKLSQLRQVQFRSWQRAFDVSERFLQRWTIVITLLLGIVVLLFGASSWN